MAVAVTNTLSATYPATAESVTEARRWAAERAVELGAGPETVEDVRLAVSEAVTNVVLHAYRGGDAPDGRAQVTVAVAGDEFWLLVSDQGRGHQMVPSTPGLGWGLALIADAAKSFVITERSGGGTELQICFELKARRSAIRTAGRAARPRRR